jgi:hypothetical protein
MQALTLTPPVKKTTALLDPVRTSPRYSLDIKYLTVSRSTEFTPLEDFHTGHLPRVK